MTIFKPEATLGQKLLFVVWITGEVVFIANGIGRIMRSRREIKQLKEETAEIERETEEFFKRREQVRDVPDERVSFWDLTLKDDEESDVETP